ncbi:MAG: lipoyl synthase, partial [Bacteroidales bacterium]
GKCPNIGECWTKGTATFMIAGEICTRSCKFCATQTGKPLPLDNQEPKKIAQSVKLMGLRHCVITSVDRDELEDKGANHWAETIKEIRKENPKTIIEVLTPDFDNIDKLLNIVFEAKPDIFGHNMETVKRLTPEIRSRAKYDLSLQVLQKASKAGIISKSGIMLGIGETEDEVYELMKDLRAVGCNLLTIGQYLQPTKENIPVQEYIHPTQFAKYKEMGMKLGFDNVESGPLVRSSYMAEETFIESKLGK